MSHTPNELYYAATHEWVRLEGDEAIIGITDHAQAALGVLVLVELPEDGDVLHAGDEAGVVESVKAASDIYTPVSGEVIAINEDLNESPELINGHPYHDGWMFRIRLSDKAELRELLQASEYLEQCAADEH